MTCEGYATLLAFYKSDCPGIIYENNDMIKVQLSKCTVLKISCKSDSLSDLVNKNSEVAASKFGLQRLKREHKSFSGGAKFENHQATHEYIYNQ